MKIGKMIEIEKVEMKVEVHKLERLTLAVLLFLTQVFPYSSQAFAAEAILDSKTLVPVTDATSTTTTSTQTSSSTADTPTPTSSEFLSNEATLSEASSPVSTIPGAYKESSVEDLEGDDYVISAKGGTQYTEANERLDVQFPINQGILDNLKEQQHHINIDPVYFSWGSFSTNTDDVRIFRTLTEGETILLSDLRGFLHASGYEPVETLPAFVQVNGIFVPLTVGNGLTTDPSGDLIPRANEIDPVGIPRYNVSFQVPALKKDGTDKVEFLSIYSATALLSTEYVINHNATQWARFSANLEQGADGYRFSHPRSHIHFISNDGTATTVATTLSESEKVVNYYYTSDGTQLVIETDTRTIILDTPVLLPPVPDGWTRAESNENFAFQIDTVNTYLLRLRLMDLVSGETQVLATASIESYGDHVFDVHDVSPNGQYVAFRTVPSDARVQEITNSTRGVTISNITYSLGRIAWSGASPTTHAILRNQGGSETYLVDLETMTYAKAIPAPSNRNFAFAVKVTPNGKEVYLLNQQSNEVPLITTAKSDQDVTAMDVDPTGKYAFVNVQRFDITDPSTGASIYTGDLHIFDIAAKTIVQPEIGANKGTIQGRVASSDYRFVDGVVLFNVLRTTFSGGSVFDGITGVVLNLNALRATQTSGFIRSDKAIFTPQMDKLLFSIDQRSNLSVAIYDVATGNIVYRSLALIGLSGIKAISPDGEYAIAGSDFSGVVIIIPIRNLAKTCSFVYVSAPPLSQASFFFGSTLVKLTLANGGIHYLDIQTLAVMPRSAYAQITSFYGGGFPEGAQVRTFTAAKDSDGKVIGWNVTVDLNQSTTAGVIQNQLLQIRRVSGEWVMSKVLDWDYQNTLIYQSRFTYASTGLLDRIFRYNSEGALLSTVYVRRPVGDTTPYYQIITVAGQKRTVDITTPLYLLLIKARKLEG